MTKQEHEQNLKQYLTPEFQKRFTGTKAFRNERHGRYFNNNSLVLIKLKGKHSEEYYVCNDLEEFYENCLYIIWQRYQSGYYFYEPEMPEIKATSLTKEQVEALPEGKVKTAAIEEIQHNDSLMREYRENVDQWNKLMLALKDRRGEIAIQILEHRSDWEYEEFDTQPITKSDLPKGDLIKKVKSMNGSYFL